MVWVTLIVAALLALLPSAAKAQSDYGQRLQSRDGKWLLPVASRILSSSDEDHLRRESINSWDLSAAEGAPVFAAAPGVVEAAGCDLYERRQWPIMRGYGCAVSIKHGGGVVSQYGHCKSGSIYIKRGDQVTATTPICQVGWTGKTSFGPHVHFAILVNGSPIRIGGLFDIRQMNYCKFCPGSNDPRASVTNGGSVTAQQQTQPTTLTRLDAIRAAIRSAGPDRVSLVVMALLGALCLVWWLGGLYERVAVVALGTSAVVVGLAFWLVMPAAPVQAGQPSAVIGNNATWKAAYSFMRRWEGARCVDDPIRTFKGVTNGTYNAWRRDQGIGPGDVCRDLTEQQAEAIYYQRYWVASGAGNLSPATAIAHFDHAVNAGVGAANGILAQCGDNADCYIEGRFADYRTKSNCPQYCAAWFNRVNDLVKFLRKGNNND